MTEQLYYKDSHIFEFEATVTESGDGYVVLDRTAFFPGGGGQLPDEGEIGGVRVTGIKGDRHLIDGHLEKGTYRCTLDKETRLRRMQNHSGEHLVSGIVHSLYGLDNVGFHMGDVITIDFNGDIDIAKVEKLANEAVRSNVPVRTSFPEKLDFDYRSKLELTENVRIVEIEGYDICACCAPHVSSTGEIGIIKILTKEPHRGGVRVTMICGMDALDLFNEYQANLQTASEVLSVPKTEVGAATAKAADDADRLKGKLAAMEEKYAATLAGDSRIVFAELGDVAQRELCNKLVEKFGTAGVFCSGKYCIGSSSVNLREKAGEINSAICGRGGGQPGMIFGNYTADEDTVRKVFEELL